MSKLKPHQHPEQGSFFETEITKTNLTNFPTAYNEIVEKIHIINPNKYAKSRNFITGAVTYLSPYISRGVISLPQVKDIIASKFRYYESEKLLQELAWREYFQRQWQFHGDKLFIDVKQAQQNVAHHRVPTALIEAKTRIDSLDTAIETLYETGYMHNHCRMYTAMLTCNVAQAHWLQPAKWMYYHLLDGDLASNHFSWQWVAGSFSSKKYFANQENISKYTNSNQKNGYLATSYEAIATMPIPEVLQPCSDLNLQTNLPEPTTIHLDETLPLLVYNSYNLDPLWHNHVAVNRVLLLEPSHFKAYPVSNKVLDFILQIAKDNIPNLQIFVGEFEALKSKYKSSKEVVGIHYKEHPTTQHYQGFKESRDWLCPTITGYFPSFFTYWKKAEKLLKY
jgi:deoxyribodipyrimidine photo-lyase